MRLSKVYAQKAGDDLDLLNETSTLDAVQRVVLEKAGLVLCLQLKMFHACATGSNTKI